MTYLKGYLSTNTRLDKKCGKGWEGTVGNCKRVKRAGTKVKAPAVGFAKRWESPAFRLQMVGLATGTFVGVNALQRQGSVMGVTPEKTEDLSVVDESLEKGLFEKEVLGQGLTGKATLVQDSKGNRYVKKEAVEEGAAPNAAIGRAMYVYSAAAESAVSDMAEDVGIPSAKVRMIPAKNGDKLGSTLQDVAKGDTKANSPPDRFVSHQLGKIEMEPFPRYEKSGLNLTNLRAMKNKDSAKILALDTFTGNADRHDGNLFYDKKTKKYTAIDNGLAFYSDGITASVTKSLKKSKSSFKTMIDIDPEIKEGLQIYRDTLSELITKYPPKKSKAKMLGYMQHESGTNMINDFYVRTGKTRVIDKNYVEAKKALKELDDLLGSI